MRRRLRRAGVPGPTVRRFPTPGQERAVELYDEKGMTLREVADYLGWYSASGTPQVAAIQKALRDTGVPTRPSGPQPRARRHGWARPRKAAARAVSAALEWTGRVAVPGSCP